MEWVVGTQPGLFLPHPHPWLAPAPSYRPRESTYGLSFPPPQKQGTQCREAVMQELLCAGVRPRYLVHLPPLLPSPALVLTGR